MLIRPLVTGINQLATVEITDTAEKAIRLIDEKGFLSIPVVDGKEFVGFLSKQYVYDEFFKSGVDSLNEFLKAPVSQFIKLKIEAVKDSIPVEEAAQLFFKNKMRFLPVVDNNGKFVGILTQKALFDIVVQMLGVEDAKLVIFSSDYTGSLARISEIISKHGANITNIAKFDTGTMGIQEICIRLEGDNLETLVEKLKSHGINVREFVPAKK